MLIVQVNIQVKLEFVDEFIKATLENARNSLMEPGIARFDVLQDSSDPAKFVLCEVYRSVDAPAKHKETDHYLSWRDTVAGMMAEPRKGIQYKNLFPDENGWG
jgi:quinol monooxygenase YgiN